MMPTHNDQLSDSISTTSSSPRSNNGPRLRFMCSFGGKVLPRPHDNQLRYVGGDTRIIAISRHTSYSALLSKLSKTVGTVVNGLTVKYQLPNEDLDALISVCNDEDVENMMDEYDRVGSKTGRLRLFLFDDRTSSISSILDGSKRRESWFLDALNGGGGGSTAGGGALERGLSDASSIVSEVPDYLFGLDSSDEPNKIQTRSNLADCVSFSDPGSPAPVMSSPFLSTSSSDAAAQTVLPASVPAGLVQSSTMWQYSPDPNFSGQIQTAMTMTSLQPMPVYYIPGPVQLGNYPVQPGPVQAQFVQQMPVGYHPAGMGQIHGVPNGGMMRTMAVDGLGHPAPGYYGQQVHVYQAAAGVEEQMGSGSDATGSGVGLGQ